MFRWGFKGGKWKGSFQNGFKVLVFPILSYLVLDHNGKSRVILKIVLRIKWGLPDCTEETSPKTISGLQKIYQD